jgi:predicted nuclease of predicted toxin-antitoxin system
MRILADVHIAPRTVQFLRSLGHDVERVGEALPGDASDRAIITRAQQQQRAILTQDLDFSAMIALGGAASPSLISLRLSSSRVEQVNEVLSRVLPSLEAHVLAGSIVTVENHRVRRRTLPIVSD